MRRRILIAKYLLILRETLILFRFNLCELREKSGTLEKECKNGGTCIYSNVTGVMTCECPVGFRGDRCEIIENYCKNEPCKNGLCKNGHGSHVCECSTGWKGVNCTEPVKACTLEEDCNANNTLAVYHSKHSYDKHSLYILLFNIV